jgi:two-component system NtrC family sensor kinase
MPHGVAAAGLSPPAETSRSGAASAGTSTLLSPLPVPAAAGVRHGFGTRRRLMVAFTALAVAFALAFGSILVGLHRIKERVDYLHEHEDQMRVVLELEGAVRDEYKAQLRYLSAPEPAQARAVSASAERIVPLLATLTARVDEPEAIAWVGATGAAVKELERSFQEEKAPAARRGEIAHGSAHASAYELVFTVEENAGRLFAFLRERVVMNSGAIGEMHALTLKLAIVFVAGTLLLAAGLAAYLARAIAAPLAVLGAGASRIASGDLATRIDLSTPDEFGTLAAEFNAMAASLEQHHERLVRSEKLAGLGRVAAGIAHELNNPLQVILGYVSLDRDRATGAMREHLARIERETVRCKEIVESLLQVARPTVSSVPVPVPLREVCDEVAEALRVAMGDRAPEIAVEGEGVARGTRTHFRQIVFNLAKNAADAAGAAGAVRIAIAGSEGQIEISVSDTGPGVSADLRELIFEPFFTTKSEGTGLGLAIARSIAASLGGDIDLERGERGGARFTVRLPAVSGQA